MTLSGSVGGYTVTFWSNCVTTDFDGGGAHITLNFLDGSSSRFEDDDILSLDGNSYYDVVSIEFGCWSGQYLGSGQRIKIADGLNNHVMSNLVEAYYSQNDAFQCPHATTGTLTLGTDIEITSLYAYGVD